MLRLFAAVALLLGFALPARAQKPLIVGMELSYPPFEMTDEKGKPTGIGVEIAEALAAKLGRKLEIQNFSFDGLIPALRTGGSISSSPP